MRMLRIAAVLGALAVVAPATAGAAWAPALDVSAPGGAATGRSNAVVPAPGGRFVVAWAWGARGSRATTAIRARRVGGGRPGRPLTLASGARAVDDVRLWPAPGGRTVATWRERRGPLDVAIRMRTIGRGDRLGPVVTITEPGDGGGDVVAVPRADGRTTVAWVARTAADTAVVKARRVSRGGTPGPVTTLTAADGRVDALVGDADMDQGVLLVYGTGGALVGQRITATGAAPRPSFPISPLGQTAGSAQVAADGTGGATVLWVQEPAPTSIQEVAVIADDKLSGVDAISAPGVASLAPSIAFRNGLGIAVWEARTPTRAAVVGLDADGRRRTLSPASAGSRPMRPQAALDRAGHGFAVWQRSHGATSVVQATRFGRTRGRQRTTLSRPSTRELFPHVAAHADGRALVTWVAAGPTGARVQAAEYRPLRLANDANPR